MTVPNLLRFNYAIMTEEEIEVEANIRDLERSILDLAPYLGPNYEARVYMAINPAVTALSHAIQERRRVEAVTSSTIKQERACPKCGSWRTLWSHKSIDGLTCCVDCGEATPSKNWIQDRTPTGQQFRPIDTEGNQS